MPAGKMMNNFLHWSIPVVKGEEQTKFVCSFSKHTFVISHSWIHSLVCIQAMNNFRTKWGCVLITQQNSVEKFKFSQILLGDKIATSL